MHCNPAVLAKSVTTIDVISGGRAVLGQGRLKRDRACRLRLRFPPIKERMDRLGEALTICHLMFTEERPTFVGEISDRTGTQPPAADPAGRTADDRRRDRRAAHPWLAAEHADWTHRFAGWSSRSGTRRRSSNDTVRRSDATQRRSSRPWVARPAGRRRARGRGLIRIAPEPGAALTPARATRRRHPEGLGGARFHRLHLRQHHLPTTESIAIAGEVLGLLARD